jgi:hypothetical protein
MTLWNYLALENSDAWLQMNNLLAKDVSDRNATSYDMSIRSSFLMAILNIQHSPSTNHPLLPLPFKEQHPTPLPNQPLPRSQLHNLNKRHPARRRASTLADHLLYNGTPMCASIWLGDGVGEGVFDCDNCLEEATEDGVPGKKISLR